MKKNTLLWSLIASSALLFLGGCSSKTTVNDPKPTSDISFTFDMDNKSILTGQEYKVYHSFKNNTTSTYAISMSMYLSKDNTYSGDDVSVGSNTLSIATGSSTVSSNVVIPAKTSSGSYYLIGRFLYVVATSGSASSTYVEYNIPLTVTYDANIELYPLTINGITFDKSTYDINNDNVDVTFNYVNRYGSDIYATYTMYVSTDQVLSPTTDYQLGSSNQSRTFYSSSTTTTDLTNYFSSSTPEGTYYVIYKGTYYNSNTSATVTFSGVSSTTITLTKAPLAVNVSSAVVNGSTNVSSGNSISVQVNYSKNAIASSQYVYFYYYLSTDSIFSADTDTYLEYNSEYISSSSSATSFVESVYLSSSLTSGNYYLIVRYSKSSSRTSTSDEFFTKLGPLLSITPPSMTVTGVGFTSGTYNPGSSVSVNLSINSNTSGASQYVKYYLSSDNVFDVNDTYINQYYVSPSSGNSVENATVTLSNTAALPSGNYYIIATYYPTGSSSSSSIQSVASSSTITIGPSVFFYRSSMGTQSTLYLFIDNSYTYSMTSYTSSNPNCTTYSSTSGSSYYKYFGSPGAHTYYLSTSSTAGSGTTVTSGNFTVPASGCTTQQLAP